MGEFSEILSVVEQELRASDTSLEVIRAFPEKARPNPQRKKLAAIGIEKVSMAPVGLNDYCMGENVSLGKKAEVWVKISFCCTNATACWELWEGCAQRLLFSEKLSFKQIECGQAVWNKEWSGIVLPVKLCCEFILSGTGEGDSGLFYPQSFHIVRKGEV